MERPIIKQTGAGAESGPYFPLPRLRGRVGVGATGVRAETGRKP